MVRTVLALSLLFAPLARSTQVVQRYTLTIDGVAGQPTVLEIFGLALDLDVVEINDGGATIRKFPANPNAGPLTFFLPEIDDEVVVMFDWFERLAHGAIELHHGDLVGYDPNGNPVARWHFENAWPSRISGPQLPSPETRNRAGHFITLQIDNLTRAASDRAAPWPDLLSTTVDRRARTFTMSWRSLAEATYNVFAWDPAARRPVLVEEGVVGTGPVTTLSRRMEDKGIFWVVLTSAPPPPGRVQP